MVGSLRRCVWKDADTSDMVDLKVPWRSMGYLFFRNGFVELRRKMMTLVLSSDLVGFLLGIYL